MNLQEAWQRSADRPVYTHYSVSGATRIDRIYATRDLISRKLGIETIAAAFTDHSAVCLRLTVDVPVVRTWRGFWKMDNTLLDDPTIMGQLRDIWGQLKQQQRFVHNAPMWWDRCCKRRITRFLKWAQAERSREHRAMVNYYYTCIYEVLQLATPDDTTLPTLNRLKAKLVRLQSVRLQKLFIDSNEADRTEGEKPTLYKVLQMKKKGGRRGPSTA
jgi:hypothetical protein